MFQKPLVGDRLGDSLLSLLDRMNEFRSNKDENLDDMLAYLDAQQYTDFRSCPDHALAVLRFAEKNELLELWRDSFCHCAGMADQLTSSGEFEVCGVINVAMMIAVANTTPACLSSIESTHYPGSSGDGPSPGTRWSFTRQLSRG